MTRVLALALLFLSCAAFGHPSAPAAGKMREQMEKLLAALPDKARAQATKPFEDRDRTDWHYTPRSRNGVSLKDLDAGQREQVHSLLKTALSSVGYR